VPCQAADGHTYGLVVGVDAWALAIAVAAFIVGGYGAVMSHRFAAREDRRREAEVARNPARVMATLLQRSGGDAFEITAEQWSVPRATSREYPKGELAGTFDVAFRNAGNSPIQLEAVELVIDHQASGKSLGALYTDVGASGPHLPVTLGKENRAIYGIDYRLLRRYSTPVPEGAQNFYGFRGRLADGTEVRTRYIRLRPPIDDNGQGLWPS
jgi:hypothetical protein